MSLGVKLDTLRGPGAPGDRLARVIFRGGPSTLAISSFIPPFSILVPSFLSLFSILVPPHSPKSSWKLKLKGGIDPKVHNFKSTKTIEYPGLDQFLATLLHSTHLST